MFFVGSVNKKTPQGHNEKKTKCPFLFIYIYILYDIGCQMKMHTWEEKSSQELLCNQSE